jgi:leucyl/phenylalanyl-tRNA--protein transferase
VPVLTALRPGDPFPPSSAALGEPNGLLAVGGTLDVATLLAAYRRGIFPWYQAPQPVLWWTPDPRAVLLPGELHVSRKLRTCLRRDGFTLSADRDFEAVVRACAAPRNGEPGTWIDDDMLHAYCALHRHGHAHSVEVRDDNGELLGGLYGVAIGAAFFGESMFSRVSNASKVALVALVWLLRQRRYRLIDCQMDTAHLRSLGARLLSRVDFEQRLAHTVDDAVDSSPWVLPSRCGELL